MPFDTASMQNMFAQARSDMDYGSHFSDMLAPYQAMAQQYSSPYALFRPDSWIAQNHPMAAKMLDTIGLAGAMTPGPQGPEGAGQGISRAFQGLVGAQQFRRQQMLQSAMLPYQMMMPMLQARDIMSQTMQRSASAPYELARGEYYMNRIEQSDRPRTVPGTLRTDDQGRKWQEIFDPTNRDRPTRLFDPASQQFADQLGTAPSFKNEEKIARQGGQSETERMVDLEDKERVAKGLPPYTATERNNRIVGFMREFSGARTAGSQGAPHPYSEGKDFLDAERKAAYGTLTSNMNPSQFQELHVSDPNYWKPGNQEKMYKDYVTQQQVSKQQMDLNFGIYRKSGAWQQGVTFQEFLADPSKYSNVPANAAAGTEGNSGSNWTPK